MARVHASVNKAREKYRRNDKSRTITPPPGAFPERIKMYNNLLERSHKQLRRKMDLLNGGLEKTPTHPPIREMSLSCNGQ